MSKSQVVQKKMHSLIFIYIYILSYWNISTPLLFTEVVVPNQEVERSCIYEFGIFLCFNDISIRFWNYFHSVVFFIFNLFYHYLYIPLKVACFIVRVHSYHRLQIEHLGRNCMVVGSITTCAVTSVFFCQCRNLIH